MDTGATPRCRMCVREARWNGTQEQYYMYCGAGSCTNRQRICQHCNAQFDLGAEGTGSKYCSLPCKARGYRPTSPKKYLDCAWCGHEGETTPSRSRAWPYVCLSCLDPLKHVVHILKKHHVPFEKVTSFRELPVCEVCGKNLLERRRDVHSGQKRTALVVDHDHECCPGDSPSCGLCVRGLLCGQCNMAIGLLGESIPRIRGALEYLEKNRRVNGARGKAA